MGQQPLYTHVTQFLCPFLLIGDAAPHLADSVAIETTSGVLIASNADASAACGPQVVAIAQFEHSSSDSQLTS